MELKRKIYHRLLEWKEEDRGRTSLLIERSGKLGKVPQPKLSGKTNTARMFL